MNAIERLRAEEQERQEQSAAIVQKEWERALGVDLLADLEASYYDEHTVTLHYRGYQRKFDLRTITLSGKTVRTVIVDWVNQVDENRAWERVLAARKERKVQRLELQEAAFVPFVFYRVHYGILALDDDGSYVEKEYIESLAGEPDDNGWWYPVQREEYPVRLTQVYKVERIEVHVHTEMPGWCLRHETEFGEIRIPPAEVELL